MKKLYITLTAAGFFGLACAVEEANHYSLLTSAIIGVVSIAMLLFGLGKLGVFDK